MIKSAPWNQDFSHANLARTCSLILLEKGTNCVESFLRFNGICGSGCGNHMAFLQRLFFNLVNLAGGLFDLIPWSH